MLIVYQEGRGPNRAAEPAAESGVGGVTPAGLTVSIDEKPGVQALANTAPDWPPGAGKHSSGARDYEYQRHGTLSPLAARDLPDGHVVARVEARPRRREFVALLKELDAHCPAAATLRVILDNHSAHISQETCAYLATRPNRFKYVQPPQTWLLVELGGDALWQAGPHFPAPYPGGFPKRNSKNASCWGLRQSTRRRSSTGGRVRSSDRLICKCFAETLY